MKSKILFSNQDLSEKNTEIIRRTNKPILRWAKELYSSCFYFLVFIEVLIASRSRSEILEHIKQYVVPSDFPRLEMLLDRMNEREMHHIDYLIHMMSYYGTASQSLLQSIIDILEEDETNLKKLMGNFLIRWTQSFLTDGPQGYQFDWLAIIKILAGTNWSNKQNSIKISFSILIWI